jgi:hypothetical protein
MMTVSTAFLEAMTAMWIRAADAEQVSNEAYEWFRANVPNILEFQEEAAKGKNQ